MGIITLRTALAQSRNVPALKAFQQTSQEQKINFVKSLGISLAKEDEGKGYLHEAYSIGSYNGSNPMEMAGAYAAFANGGYFTKPYTIKKIVFRDTNEVVEHAEENKQVMSSATAFMITDCLKTAVTSGLSGAGKISGVNVAAKTGTTNYTAQIRYKYKLGDDALNDAWIVGYDPDTVISLWYGYDPISSKYWSNPSSALRNRKNLFSALGSKIFKKNGQDFTVPNTVVKVGVEKTSDVNREPKLASQYTPSDKVVYEWFKKGTEPTEVSAAYQRLSDVSGLTGNYNDTTKVVKLTWKAIPTPSDNLSGQYGELGYKVYKDGKLLGFTNKTEYVINNATNPNGTYRVSAGYKNVSTVDSLGVTVSINYSDPAVYDAELTVPSNTTYGIEDALSGSDANPSKNDVKVTKDGAVVTPTSVSISISDSNGNNVANISTSEANEYTITYLIKYGNYTTKLTRKVKIAGATNPENE
jgi:penicillin-binding protein 1A